MSADIPSVTGQSLLILAVDDDVLVQMNTVAMLEELGHRVIEASNGADALELARSRRDLNLIITDQAMPRMTGKDLALAVAKERPDLPVIIATGYAELPESPPDGAIRLPKPFDLEDLARAIAQAIGT